MIHRFGENSWGWFSYVEDDILVIGESYPHEGGELYRGKYMGDDTPYLLSLKKDDIKQYNRIVKYFNTIKKTDLVENRKGDRHMNTSEMWANAQNDGKIYECVDGDIAYSKDMGLVDRYDFNTPWGLDAWGYKKQYGLDDLMSCEWQEMSNVMTIKEAENRFGIKIIK